MLGLHYTVTPPVFSCWPLEMDWKAGFLKGKNIYKESYVNGRMVFLASLLKGKLLYIISRTELSLDIQNLLRRCFMYVLGVQIPSQQVFGCLVSQTLYLLSFFFACKLIAESGASFQSFYRCQAFLLLVDFWVYLCQFQFYSGWWYRY